MVRVRPGSPASVGELQLLWESSSGPPEQKLASVKLYFMPEHTPTGRQSCHGQVDDKFVFNSETNDKSSSSTSVGFWRGLNIIAVGPLLEK